MNEVEVLIHKALDAGMTTFDNADIYGDYQNEQTFGTVLEGTSSLREKMQLVTKCCIMNVSTQRPSNWIKHYNTSRQHIVWSVENSLKSLHTDRVDLLLLHRPDPLLDPHEVAQTFSALKADGKVLHFGVSNFTSHQFQMLQSYLDFPLVTNQIEVSLTHQQPMFDGTIDDLMRFRVAPMAWSPLGGGTLVADPSSKLLAKASKYNATPPQMLLAWLLRHPSRIFPVIGTSKPERLIEAAASINIKLDLQDWFDMWKEGKHRDVP